jgi:hypothetical protein
VPIRIAATHDGYHEYGHADVCVQLAVVPSKAVIALHNDDRQLWVRNLTVASHESGHPLLFHDVTRRSGPLVGVSTIVPR